MAFGEILDGAIKLLRANARTMVLLVITIAIPFEFFGAFLERNVGGGAGILQIFHDPTAASQSGSSTPFAADAFSILIILVVVPLVCGGASRVVMASYLGGELTYKDALLSVLKHAPALLAASVIVHLAETVGALGFFVSAAFVMPLFMLTAPAIALEDLGPFAAIRRSVSLARRRYWPTVGIALLSGVLASILASVLGLVPGVVALFVGLRWGWIIVGATNVLIAVVTMSLITIVATLVYIDARIRQEGFDLHVMASRTEAR